MCVCGGGGGGEDGERGEGGWGEGRVRSEGREGEKEGEGGERERRRERREKSEWNATYRLTVQFPYLWVIPKQVLYCPHGSIRLGQNFMQLYTFNRANNGCRGPLNSQSNTYLSLMERLLQGKELFGFDTTRRRPQVATAIQIIALYSTTQRDSIPVVMATYY